MNRLPGPMTMISASAIAASASSEARTSSGVIQTRSIPARAHDPRLARRPPIPSRSRAWRVERRRRDRQRPGRGPPGRGSSAGRPPRSRRPRPRSSPRSAGSRRRGRPRLVAGAVRRPGKRYCSSSAHERLGVGEGDDAVADVADRRDAELSRSLPDEPPSSATVTIAVRLLVCSFRPRRSVDRPVPPPMATIRGPRARKRFW